MADGGWRPSVLNDIYREKSIRMWEYIIRIHENEVESKVSSFPNDADEMYYKNKAIMYMSDDELTIHPIHGCYVCEEASARGGFIRGSDDFDCSFCPLQWNEDVGSVCCDCGSPYSDYCDSETPQEAMQHAESMVKLLKTWKTTDEVLISRGIDPSGNGIFQIVPATTWGSLKDTH